MQDYIAMVLVWFATQFSANHASDAISEDVARQLASLEKQLDEVLAGS
jgi:hypothetical protein